MPGYPCVSQIYIIHIAYATFLFFSCCNLYCLYNDLLNPLLYAHLVHFMFTLQINLNHYCKQINLTGLEIKLCYCIFFY